MKTKIKSDIFNFCESKVRSNENGSTVIIPHVCNNIGLFGAGFAGAVRSRYPIVAQNFEMLGNHTKLGYVQYISDYKKELYNHEMIFANMIAQNGIVSSKNRRPLNYEALVKCMTNVRNFIQNSDKENVEIHCPKFGSGLAGGDWKFIEQLIEDIWPNYTICVHTK